MNLIVLGGSIAGIILLWLAAHWLQLGGDVRLAGRDAAVAIADADGFIAQDAIVDRAGIGALVRDDTGRHMLIRRHGVHFVTRVLHAPLNARLDKNFLTIGTSEASFGRVTLDLGDQAADWAASLRTVQ